MAFSNDAYDLALDGLLSVAVKMSLHDGDPSTTGANEVTGGSYAKKTCSWDAASGGSAALADNVVFDVPATEGVAWAGLWLTDGTTFLFGIDLPDETFTIDGTYTVLADTTTVGG